MSKGNETPKRGPEPERLAIEGDWKDAIDKALDSKTKGHASNLNKCRKKTYDEKRDRKDTRE